MTNDEIKNLCSRAEKLLYTASPGPWHVKDYTGGLSVSCADGTEILDVTVWTNDHEDPDIYEIAGNAAMAAAAPTLAQAVLDLVAQVETLRATLRRISNHGREVTYCRDGHEEAVLHARTALKGGTDG